MCEFVSWIEKDNKIYFLTAAQIFDSPRGEALRKGGCAPEDYVGHGAIREYYDIPAEEGENRECVDFSTPENFPREIAQAIKCGDFRGLAAPLRILSRAAHAEYHKIFYSAYAEYNKIFCAAYSKCSARAERDKIFYSAYAEYNKIVNDCFWDLFANAENRDPAWQN